MIPDPGFQKPMPYFAPAEDRKSYTSLFVLMACARSAGPPNELSLCNVDSPVNSDPQQCISVLQDCGDSIWCLVNSAPVFLRSSSSLDQMVAVNGGGHGCGGQAGGDELQHSHLRCGVLHRHPICTSLQTCFRILHWRRHIMRLHSHAQQPYHPPGLRRR